MSALDSYTPRQSAALGAGLAAGNPKNLVMALAAGAEIAALTTTAGAALVGVGVFVLVGSIGVATPAIAHRLLGDRAPEVLGRWKSWLEANSTALASGVLVRPRRDAARLRDSRRPPDAVRAPSGGTRR